MFSSLIFSPRLFISGQLGHLTGGESVAHFFTAVAAAVFYAAVFLVFSTLEQRKVRWVGLVVVGRSCVSICVSPERGGREEKELC